MALYQQLGVAKEGRDIFLDQQVAAAASFSSVLSLPYVLDELVPLLEGRDWPRRLVIASTAPRRPESSRSPADGILRYRAASSSASGRRACRRSEEAP